MKIIRHQFFTIHSHVYRRKHLMILVNTLHQNFYKNSCGELIHLKNPHKSSQNFKITRTHYFINQRSYLNYFSNKSTKTPFGCYFLIIWLNGSFFLLRCSKSSLVGKKCYGENGETRNGDKKKAQMGFAIRQEFVYS